MSKGKRSGVNWMREKFAAIEEVIALASVVLPTPELLSRARASRPDARPNTNPPRYPYPRPPGGRPQPLIDLSNLNQTLDSTVLHYHSKIRKPLRSVPY